MLPDNPHDLIAGKDYGSEGIAQRYLTALQIGGPEYGYNKSWPLTARGIQFIEALYERAFGTPPRGAPTYWNEMNLRAVNASDEQAVDYGYIWPSVRFLVELKTLGRSHRAGQLAEYLRRAKHHNPGQAIDLLYVTHPVTYAAPDVIPEGCRYDHLFWLAVLEIAVGVWGESNDPREVRCLSALTDHLQAEGALTEAPNPAARGGARIAGLVEPLSPEWRRVLDDALEAATRAARGKRGAIEVPVGLADDEQFAARLERLKAELESHISATPALTGVKVWRWETTTSAVAYTEAGRIAGRELRLTPPSA